MTLGKRAGRRLHLHYQDRVSAGPTMQMLRLDPAGLSSPFCWQITGLHLALLTESERTAIEAGGLGRKGTDPVSLYDIEPLRTLISDHTSFYRSLTPNF